MKQDSGSYCRGMVIKADNPEVMFVGNGDFIPGTTGAVQRTKDGGKSWEPVSSASSAQLQYLWNKPLTRSGPT